MNKKRRDQKGFTMVELVIVIAIMGIIGAVLVPSFSAMSAKARLTTDISTVKALKRTIDVYKAEQGVWPTGTFEGEDTVLGGLNAELVDAGYLDSKAILKISDAEINYTPTDGTIKLNITKPAKDDKQLFQAFDKLDQQTKDDWIDEPDDVEGPTSTPTPTPK